MHLLLDLSPSVKHLSGQKRKVFAQEQCKWKAKNQGGINQVPFSSTHKVVGSVDPLALLLWPQACGQFCWCLALPGEDGLLRAVGRLRTVKWSWWGVISLKLWSERMNSRKNSEITNKSARIVLARVQHSASHQFSIRTFYLHFGIA